VKSLILSVTTRLLIPLLVLLSLFLLFRGHNEPGGGFVAGLTVAVAFRLYAFAYDIQDARRALPLKTREFIAIGLLLAVGSGLLPLAFGEPFMTGLWIDADLPVLGHVGTPLLFDIGVYMVVIGATLTIIVAMAEADERGE
jgi:multicomponent Na+:H+ antiporter subunit B